MLGNEKTEARPGSPVAKSKEERVAWEPGATQRRMAVSGRLDCAGGYSCCAGAALKNVIPYEASMSWDAVILRIRGPIRPAEEVAEPEFLQDYSRWMEDMFGEGWQGNRRVAAAE
jgi:hypothetical protein